MTQFEMFDIDEVHVRHLFETLPEAWKKTRGFLQGGLILVLAKMWEFEDTIIGFSAWYSGFSTFACSIRYQRSDKSCIGEVEIGPKMYLVFLSTLESTKRKFHEAIVSSLGGNQFLD